MSDPSAIVAGMLELLRVRAFAIIEELEVHFAPGFNVLTGETGAGKSILVEALHLVLGGRAQADSVRVGDLARELRITVGGTSKLVDRIERAGLIAREPDPDDGRASRVLLTTAGKRRLTAALRTYETEVSSIIGGALRPEEQQRMSDYVSRLLTSIDQGEGA